MSRLKIKNWYTIILIALLSTFLFGCENDVPVDSIAFNVGEVHQLVFVKGDDLDLEPMVEIKPGYATNKKFTITSSRTDIVSVDGSVITAVEVGSSVIRVVSKDNPKKEDIMTVVVKGQVEPLAVPMNLKYDEDTSSITFGMVEGASDYTLNINGVDYMVGNTNVFPISRIDGVVTDKLMTVKVRAEAPKYSYAYLSSEFSEEYKFYQASAVENLKVVGGDLSFDTVADNNIVTINGDEYVNTTSNSVSLVGLDESLAGKEILVGVKSMVNETNVKEVFGQDVKCFDSLEISKTIKVMDIANPTIISGVVSWKSLVGAKGYKLYLDNENMLGGETEITETYFDLNNLANMNTLITSASVKELKVVPVLSPTSENIATTNGVKKSRITRLANPSLLLGEEGVSWDSVANAKSYIVNICVTGENSKSFSVTNNSLTLSNYEANKDIVISVIAENAEMDNGINYLSSSSGAHTYKKNNTAEIKIEDYRLKIKSALGEKYKVEFTHASKETLDLVATGDETVVDLSGYVFSKGGHDVSVTHLGNGSNTINSEVSKVSFVQLEPITAINISNGVAKVSKSSINKDATIELRTIINGNEEIVRGLEWKYNTTEEAGALYLDAGSYATSVYVLGDGSTTFSYREAGVEVASSTKYFEVLACPVFDLDSFNSANGNISFGAVTNATKYERYILDGSYKFDKVVTTTVETSLNGGASIDFKVKTKGNGSTYLDSKLSENVKIYKLNSPAVEYNNQTNAFSIKSEDSNNRGLEIKQNGDSKANLSNISLVSGNNALVFKSLAKSRVANQCYIDSNTSTLNIYKITDESQMTIENNSLVITPNSHSAQYDIVVKFDFGGEIAEFRTSGNNLVCSGYNNLPFKYEAKKYIINLVDSMYQPIINKMGNNFNVSIKYLAPKVDNSIANSEYSAVNTFKLETLSSPVLSRVGQTIVFDNVVDSFTTNNYKIIVNNSNKYLMKDYGSVNEGKVIIDTIRLLNTLNTDEVVEIKVEVNSISASSGTLSSFSSPMKIRRNNALAVSYINVVNGGKTNGQISIDLSAQNNSFDKEYVVSIQDNIKRYSNTTVGSSININIDEFDPRLDAGQVTIFADVETIDNYSDDGLVEVFNAKRSNVLTIKKLEAPKNVYISNNVLKFDAVAGAVGYEIYTVESNNYTILTNMISINSFKLDVNTLGLVNDENIVVKAIAKSSEINSNYSETVTAKLTNDMSVYVEGGHIVVNLGSDINALMLEKVATLSLSVGKINIDLGDIDENVAKLDNGKLTIYADNVLSYEYEVLTAENIEFGLKITYSASKGDKTYSLNPNKITNTFYALFSVTNIEKETDSDNDEVDFITWEANPLNEFKSAPISESYLLKISYNDGKNSVSYLSTDDKLKYYENMAYRSYGEIISNKIRFPYGYDSNADGEIDIIFGAGDYEISIQSMAREDRDMFCLSKFSSVYKFSIMEAPTLRANNGLIEWDRCPNATSYRITITQGSTTITDEVATNEYDFSNSKLNSTSGVCSVVVKAISTKKDVINSADSKPISIYRIPVVTDVTIDDGMIKFSADKYFTSAQLVLINKNDRTDIKTYYFDNADKANTALGDLSVDKWADLPVDNTTYNLSTPISYIIPDDLIKELPAASYSLKIKLIGITNNIDYAELSLVSSYESSEYDLVVEKLRPNLYSVETGALTYSVPTQYNGVTMNYHFGQDNEFMKNTIIYKVELKTPVDNHYIYAIDYASFDKAVTDGTITTSDYVLHTDKENLYATVKYNTGSEILYFNVYKDNKLDFSSYDAWYYHKLTQNILDGQISYIGEAVETKIDIASGGLFFIDVYLLGGDQYVASDRVGYINAKNVDVNPFVRYGVNSLSTIAGMVGFKNLIEYDEDGEEIDYPIYRFSYLPINNFAATPEIIYYYVYEDGLTEQEALTNLESVVALMNDDMASIEYVLIPKSETSGDSLTLDLSQYIEGDKSYNLSIRTLAGVGTGVSASNYLLNAKVPTTTTVYSKYSTSNIRINSDGLLEFDMSYVTINENKVYAKNYELVLIDKDSRETIIEFNTDTEGVTFDEAKHIIIYNLPSIYGDSNYSIKIRAKSVDNGILNSSYSEIFNFGRMTQATDIKIEEGKLKWKVDGEVSKVYVNLSYIENGTAANITIVITDLRKEGDYYYYNFLDTQYALSSTIMTTDYVKSGIDYTISIMVVGDPAANVINSGYVEAEDTANRLAIVDGITTQDGILTWNEVNNAESYDIKIIGGNNKEFNTTDTQYDLITMIEAGELIPGSFSVIIRAIGGNKITAMASEKVDGFIILDQVQGININDEYTLSWTETANATHYLVGFDYTDAEGTTHSWVDNKILVDTNVVTAPEGIVGLFTMHVQAIGYGNDKLISGIKSTFTSATERPMSVGEILYDEINHRYYWEVNTNKVDADEFYVRYTIAKYNSTGSVESGVRRELRFVNNYTQNYFQIDDDEYRDIKFSYLEDGDKVLAYLPLTTMAKYIDFAVTVVRPGTVASGVAYGEDLDLDIYQSGSGTVEAPYEIANIKHLLNVNEYGLDNKYFKLTASINLDDISRLPEFTSLENILTANNNGDYTGLITARFNGKLDGQGYNIYASEIKLKNVNQFSLFGYLDGATIENVIFGIEKENFTMILSNSFASDVENVVQLSLIATGAKNSIIKNVDFINFEINLSGTTFKNSIYLTAMVVNDEGSTITSDSSTSADIGINITGNVTGSSYLAGLIANAKNTNVANQGVNFTMTSTDGSISSFVGGIIAYYEGQNNLTKGITNSTVNITISNVDTNYLGGIVGIGKYMLLESNTITGTITMNDLYRNSYTGGVAGAVQGARVSNNIVNVNFNMTILTQEATQKIGAIVGSAVNYESVITSITNNNVFNTDLLGKTQINLQGTKYVVNLGLYGDVGNYVEIKDNIKN